MSCMLGPNGSLFSNIGQVAYPAFIMEKAGWTLPTAHSSVLKCIICENLKMREKIPQPNERTKYLKAREKRSMKLQGIDCCSRLASFQSFFG